MNNLKNSGTVATKKGAYRIRVHPFLHLTKRALLASLGAGLGSLSLMIIAVVAELLERRWFPLLIITVALVLQVMKAVDESVSVWFPHTVCSYVYFKTKKPPRTLDK